MLRDDITKQITRSAGVDFDLLPDEYKQRNLRTADMIIENVLAKRGYGLYEFTPGLSWKVFKPITPGDK
jgi:hypothetical protein